MTKGRDTRHAHSRLIGLFLLAILSVASAPGWAVTLDIDGLVERSLVVGILAEEEVNLLPPGAVHAQSPGATITGNLYVYGPVNEQLGGTVNIEYVLMTGLIVVNPGAKVTIKGKDFAVSGAGVLDDPTNPTSVSFKNGPGTLTVTYENGTTTELRFIYTSQPVYLNTGGPDKIPVDVDIKPGSDENIVNPTSNGLIPVAIYTTEDFDATQIDPASIDLGGAKVAVRGKSGKLMAHSEDVNGDGKVDLMLQVELPSEGVARATSEGPAWVTGEVKLAAETFDGDAVEGSDKIVVISDKE